MADDPETPPDADPDSSETPVAQRPEASSAVPAAPPTDGATESGDLAPSVAGAEPDPETPPLPRASRWSLSDVALARPVTVGMVLLTVVLLGVIGMVSMPLAFLPTREANQVSVRVRIDRTSPEVLEREVVRPLEEVVAGVRGLQQIQVGTGTWGARLRLTFAPGIDADAAKLEVRDRIEQARPNMPDLVRSVSLGSHRNEDDPVIEMRISSGTDLSQDYYLIEERIVRRIERIPGVARVELEGVKPHELEIAVDVEEAQRAGVSLGRVSQTVRGAQQGRTLGSLDQTRNKVGVRMPAVIADPDAFAGLPVPRGVDQAEEDPAAVRAGGGVPVVRASTTPATATTAPDPAAATASTAGALAPDPTAAATALRPLATSVDEEGPQAPARLAEVAAVTVHPESNRDGKSLNGRPAINLEVYAQAGASTVEVTRAIREEVERIGGDPALDGVDLLVFHDQGQVIVQTLVDLRDTGLYGGLLGVLVLFLFLHRGTLTVAAAVSIPLSVCAACAVMFAQGGELNCIVLLGLVLSVGMLIDNAVVIVESIATHARKGLAPLDAAREGAREVGFATIASTLSTVIVFIPLLLSDPTQTIGAYMRPLGATLAIALAASLLVSQTAVPLLMGRVLRVRSKQTKHRLLDAVAGAYRWFIRHTLKVPRLTVLVGLGLASTAYIPGKGLVKNAKLGPLEPQASHMPIRLEIAGSRGFERIGGHVKVAEEALVQRKEEAQIEDVACSWGDYWANCRAYPSKRFESETEYEEFKRRLAAALPEQPGVKYRLGERRHHFGPNQDRNVVEFVLRGEDMGVLMLLAEDVAGHLEQRLVRGERSKAEPGTFDLITTPYTEGAVELHAVLDGPKLRRLGLTPDDVAGAVSLAFQGVQLGKVRGERGEITLRMTANTGSGMDEGRAALRDLQISTPAGEKVPLSNVAQIELSKRPFWVQRADRQTEVKIGVRFFDTDKKANFDRIREALADFPFPDGYSWGRGTQWRKQAEASNETLINLGLCLLLVYAVMASLFESFLQPLGILVTCLLGCFGAPWALHWTETSLDNVALIGFFILIGIVVNNGIMLVDKVSQLRARGMARDEALAQAGRDRLRPILMTMTTTVLGLVPMLIHHPTLAGVYYHSIAIVIAGGLATGTVVTLIFLPAAYVSLEDFSRTAIHVWRRIAPGGRR